MGDIILFNGANILNNGFSGSLLMDFIITKGFEK